MDYEASGCAMKPVEEFYVACSSAKTAIWKDVCLRFNPEGHHARLDFSRDELLVMKMIMATPEGNSILRQVARAGCLVGEQLERARKVLATA